MFLPDDVIRHIRGYLRWTYVATLVSRQWLYTSLRRRVRFRSWRGKVRLYSFMNTFGPAFVGMSWHTFCGVLGVNRRARNFGGSLSWKASAHRRMRTNHCRACGCATRARVFGTHICRACRFNPRLKFAYMVKVYEARAAGVPKRLLDTIPYHRHCYCRLRFRHEIELLVDEMARCPTGLGT